jgi:poly(3-hydroxyalkanoate) synthetase
VDLSNIECSSLNIVGKKAFCCPLSQVEGAMDLISSQDKEFLAWDAGHIGLMTGPAAKTNSGRAYAIGWSPARGSNRGR